MLFIHPACVWVDIRVSMLNAHFWPTPFNYCNIRFPAIEYDDSWSWNWQPNGCGRKQSEHFCAVFVGYHSYGTNWTSQWIACKEAAGEWRCVLIITALELSSPHWWNNVFFFPFQLQSKRELFFKNELPASNSAPPPPPSNGTSLPQPPSNISSIKDAINKKGKFWSWFDVCPSSLFVISSIFNTHTVTNKYACCWVRDDTNMHESRGSRHMGLHKVVNPAQILCCLMFI